MSEENKMAFLGRYGNAEHISQALEHPDADTDVAYGALDNPALKKVHLEYIQNAKHGKYDKFSDNMRGWAKQEMDRMS